MLPAFASWLKMTDVVNDWFLDRMVVGNSDLLGKGAPKVPLQRSCRVAACQSILRHLCRKVVKSLADSNVSAELTPPWNGEPIFTTWGEGATIKIPAVP